MSNKVSVDVVILGAGPGGYSAAIRCSHFNLKTLLVDKYHSVGGTCLHFGCIPSKALLNIIKSVKEFNKFNKYGIFSGNLEVNIEQLRFWKNNLVNKLSNSLLNAIKINNINIIYGVGRFVNSNTLIVENKQSGEILVNFKHAIIATGSIPNNLFNIEFDNKYIWNSTTALNLPCIPNKLLIIGGGVIGLELANIYNTLGSKVDVIEISDQLISSLDKDITDKLMYQIENNTLSFKLNTKISSIKINNSQVMIKIDNEELNNNTYYYDNIIIVIGRKPNIDYLCLEKIGIETKNNYIIVNNQMKTNINHIYAIGDVIGTPMLAHKSMHNGYIAAEVIAGKKHFFDQKVIPLVIYTNPELCWTGCTIKQAKHLNIDFEVVDFNWSNLGKAVVTNNHTGLTRLIFNKDNNHLIGGGVLGINSSEILGELSIAIEMSCEAEDIVLTSHAHPTLYESIQLATEMYMIKKDINY
ncbi:MAG: dihydrolipoyl dehydrogenase [Candidatus Lightella neohaematopini]|nr:dihydrolipoyl dehydrogenase [Candidatus Lightella neohaematopini]